MHRRQVTSTGTFLKTILKDEKKISHLLKFYLRSKLNLYLFMSPVPCHLHRSQSVTSIPSIFSIPSRRYWLHIACQNTFTGLKTSRCSVCLYLCLPLTKLLPTFLGNFDFPTLLSPWMNHIKNPSIFFPLNFLFLCWNRQSYFLKSFKLIDKSIVHLKSKLHHLSNSANLMKNYKKKFWILPQVRSLFFNFTFLR